MKHTASCRCAVSAKRHIGTVLRVAVKDVLRQHTTLVLSFAVFLKFNYSIHFVFSNEVVSVVDFQVFIA